MIEVAAIKKCRILFVVLFFFTGKTGAQQALELWYQQPAEKWTDALPIGNGRMGAMIYGGVEQEHIQFNEETLWTGRPRNYEHKGASNYLQQIRQLLFDGKQEAAEQLAEQHFMGLKDKDDAVYAKEKKDWLVAQRVDTLAAAFDTDDARWASMELPTLNGWETQDLQGLDGVVWFRNSFILPAAWQGKDLVIHLGRIRDEDFTYINGVLIGNSEGISTKRNYRIPAAALKTGLNSIAVQVINFFDKGGFTGVKSGNDLFTIHPSDESNEAPITLTNNWKYLIANNDPPAYPQYQASYQPFGDLYFTFDHTGNISNYKRALSLKDATATVSYKAGGAGFTREYIASAPSQVIAIRYKSLKGGSLTLDGYFGTPHASYKTKKIDNNTLALYVQVKNGALKGVAYLHVKCKGGTLKIDGNHIKVNAATEMVCYLTAATNFISYNNVSGNPEAICKQKIKYAITKSYDFVKANHVRDYQSYFNRFKINLGPRDKISLPTDERIKQYTAAADPGLVALYVQYGRYLLISSSRPGSQPANLQGIWNDQLTPSWGSKYTTNINLEMNYWPAEPLHLAEFERPLFSMINDLSKTGALTAKSHYNAPGWIVHHNTDIWRGSAPINAANHGIWVGGAAWLCQQLWEHYLYSQDLDFLRDNYPIIKSAATFYNYFLIKDPVTGYYISSPSNSPEQGGLVAGPAMDHQIIRELFRNCIAASKLLKKDVAFRDALQQKLTQIAPNKIGKYGQLQEWMQDVDDTSNTHRHVSHLWGVYPGTDITWKDPDMMKAALQSLHYRGNGGTGWSLAWKLNLYARFKKPAEAIDIIGKLLSPAENASGSEQGGVYKNLFDAHPPFQIDGNFGTAAGVAEMLVQSHQGFIDVLPALPAEWPTGNVRGVCVRGGFVMDIYWKGGQLQKLLVKSKEGKPLSIQYAGKKFYLKTRAGQSIRVNRYLKKY